jgi:hypothetical protein
MLPLPRSYYDPDGREIARQRLGVLPRAHTTALQTRRTRPWTAARLRACRAGLRFFADGGEADGWSANALFRYSARDGGHAGSTPDFGAACFQHVDGPIRNRAAQSLCRAGRRGLVDDGLFLRLGNESYGHALSPDLPARPLPVA